MRNSGRETERDYEELMANSPSDLALLLEIANLNQLRDFGFINRW